MTGKRYTHITYGLGRVYDSELDAWREPMTAVEVEHIRRLNESLEQSFVETVDDDLPRQS